jgi:aryl-phospho-beta-D-glucosidase BglC (GH1 family)
VLKGQNIGIWGIIEPNMLGTPGVEHRLLRAMELYAGEGKTKRFMDGMLNKWLTEPDIRFLKEIGCNSIRLPFNYRRFEDDANPFSYKSEAFEMFDNVISWCRKYEIYAVLDMHVAPGYQMGDFCGDNLFEERCGLYYDGLFQKRFLELWKAIALHYRSEEWVAGYDLMNEPVANGKYETEALNAIYRKAVATIRSVDPDHAIFIEGNFWARNYDDMDAPFAENLIYSPHYYCLGATRPGQYPGTEAESGDYCDIDAMRAAIGERDAFMAKHGVPCWIGEFGARRFEDLDGKHRALKDYFTVIRERGHSWCYWDFKDLGLRGPLYIDPKSAWAEFVRDIVALKERYKTDRSNILGAGWDLGFVFRDYEPGDFVWDKKTVEARLVRNMRETLGDMLTMTFGKKFGELSNGEIDALTDSFLFENCLRYEPWIEIFKEAAGQ